MRKTILLAIWIIGGCLYAHAQFDFQSQRYKLKIDTALVMPSFKTSFLTTPFLANSKTKSLFAHPMYGRITIYHMVPYQGIKVEQNLIAVRPKAEATENMPCIVPQGVSPMPVIVPDSSVKFHILIK
jgi:hypothetical protein